MLVGRRGFHRREYDSFSSLRIDALQNNGGYKTLRDFNLRCDRIVSMTSPLILRFLDRRKWAIIGHTIVYSGFSHFCFWQCSASILTGSFPVHDAPPMTSFTEGFLGSSVEACAFFAVSADRSAAALAALVPGLGAPPRASFFFLGGMVPK